MRRIHTVVELPPEAKAEYTKLREEHKKVAQTIMQLQASLKQIWASVQARQKELIAQNKPSDFTLNNQQHGAITENGFIVYYDAGNKTSRYLEVPYGPAYDGYS